MISFIVKQAYAQSSEISNPVLPASLGAGDGGSALAILIASLWRAIIVLGGIALILYLVWGGIEWVMAGGDKGKVEAARTKMTQSVVGMAILAATVAIAIFLSGVLKIDLLNPVFYGPDSDSGSNNTNSGGRPFYDSEVIERQIEVGQSIQNSNTQKK